MTATYTSFQFTTSADPRPPEGGGLWFMFRGRELLVGERLTVPRGPSPAAFGLTPLRVHFIGCLEGERCFSAELAPDAGHPEGTRFVNLRRLYGRLPEPLAGMAARAVQTLEWDRTHQFCGACAAPTRYHAKARARVCTRPECGLEFFPRLAPAVIVAVERGPEILLARSPHFAPGRYSVLAGFVEPGETLEEAVRREVAEEVSLEVADARYFASQPWPFPSPLMIGYVARHLAGEIRVDESELAEADWFAPDALPPVPGRFTIARWLIDDFVRRHTEDAW